MGCARSLANRNFLKRVHRLTICADIHSVGKSQMAGLWRIAVASFGNISGMRNSSSTQPEIGVSLTDPDTVQQRLQQKGTSHIRVCGDGMKGKKEITQRKRKVVPGQDLCS